MANCKYSRNHPLRFSNSYIIFVFAKPATLYYISELPFTLKHWLVYNYFHSSVLSATFCIHISTAFSHPIDCRNPRRSETGLDRLRWCLYGPSWLDLSSTRHLPRPSEMGLCSICRQLSWRWGLSSPLRLTSAHPPIHGCLATSTWSMNRYITDCRCDSCHINTWAWATACAWQWVHCTCGAQIK
jgi:hypothetical protein